MKKTFLSLLFSLFCISLFASGHGTNAIATLLYFLLGIIIFIGLFIVLTVLTGINAALPGKIRSGIFTVLFSIFTIVGIWVISVLMEAYSALGEISSTIYGGIIFFVILFTLNAVFLLIAFGKLKK